MSLYRSCEQGLRLKQHELNVIGGKQIFSLCRYVDVYIINIGLYSNIEEKYLENFRDI